jgi:hypothetical protein
MLLALVNGACGGNDTPLALDADIDVDASRQDALLPSPDAPESAETVLGAWISTTQYSAVYRQDVLYTFTGSELGGPVVIKFQRIDFNGTYSNCVREDEATGTWTLIESTLDVVVDAGVTLRVTDGPGLRCNETYPQRAMTAEDLRTVDFADGAMRFDHRDLVTTIITEGGWPYEVYWQRPNGMGSPAHCFSTSELLTTRVCVDHASITGRWLR